MIKTDLAFLTYCNSILEMLMINQKLEELDDRLNVLLGNILVN
jgi:hypothetical protein